MYSSDTPITRRRVLVVDDSAFMRRLVSDVVTSSGEFEVVGTAKDGHDALRQVAALDPDLVTLDVDMPGLDGLAALDAIMHDMPRPVVMLSAGGSDGGVEATLRALERGAVEFVRKPSGAISLDLELVREQLLDALRAAAGVTRAQLVARAPHATREQVEVFPRASTLGIRQGGERLSHPPTAVVVIAASTGGPAALADVVPQLPPWRDVAVLVVQHMPAGFTASFAKRLSARSRLPVHEAVDGEPLRAGQVYVAPGGLHLRVTGPLAAPQLRLDEAPPLWGVRPAADHLFHSAAQCFGAATVGVVMTGMGRDAADGLQAIRAAGGLGLVQESATCVVPGMPEAARRIAGADAVVPLAALAAMITAHVATRRAITSRAGDISSASPVANP
jgi:two-component system chemotaxis response regulator CheB